MQANETQTPQPINTGGAFLFAQELLRMDS